MTTRSAGRPLAAPALQHVVQRLQRAAAPPWLHDEVARRMAERLLLIRQRPRRVIDWDAFLGAGRRHLEAVYPQAEIVAVEADAPRRDASAAALAQPWWSPRRWVGGAGTVLLASALPAAAGELLWSNMGLHFAADPQAVMHRWQRAIATDGFLMFSTLGPGSLPELRALYAAQGWGVPHAPFVDMHDLGDMLLEAGFADPVMDQEIVTLTWADGEAALAELRTLGGNADPQRSAGLRTPRWRRRLAQALQQQAAGPDGRVRLSFEVVYGHAFRPLARPRVQAETRLPLDELRAMVRARSADPRRDPDVP
ncbi:MAG: biotin synthase [Rubrivivax sp.]|nr:biotin synthase [Rubrivivax sp.]